MSKFWVFLTVVAVLFPFVAVAYKVASEESILTTVVYIGILAVLAICLGAAARVKRADPPPPDTPWDAAARQAASDSQQTGAQH
jgi:hypothetical protein